ncbi:alpha-ketoglutarate-dependent dioxygenase AlkB family protein [Acinetobacter pseudolwoffii]|uniref:alpha-ketoglutarate-dependent dioxygenase AlkB family protein n=1 Tax=Acinetobacter pseudolwoffii TaxID=2053287 RepID=UPI0025767E12|nr:alpha-ketoglutarate-dependent dioxygenase AlkB [Acinetobacter pseudolwoffii]MDM1341274.1 alpha-ketoglutarate-dependent dioxygenase AlkB [Acinetobacter pseudolwoffii]
MTLDLFVPQPETNILPFDGVVEDYGLILEQAQSQQYLQYFLSQLAWQHDEVRLFGKHYVTARKVVWYGDAHYQYRYSGTLKQAQLWLPGLLRLKQHIEQLVGHPFNSCLANLYEDGSQGLGWHSDDEPALYTGSSRENVIASLSLGAIRKMSFKHKTHGDKVELLLHSGQLIVMRGQTQQYWKHSIGKSSKVLTPRINLTFRYFYP